MVKEGVDGSNPSEGSAKVPHVGRVGCIYSSGRAESFSLQAGQVKRTPRVDLKLADTVTTDTGVAVLTYTPS